MKKRFQAIFILLFVICNPARSIAQITINSSDMPNAGNIIRISNGQAFPGMNAALTGANYSWDYSQLVPVSQTVDTFVSILSTGLYAAAFFSNSSFALKSNTPTFSLFNFLTIDYDYDFFNKSTSAYVQTGFGARLNGFPIPFPYDPKDTIYRFPLNFQDTDSGSSAFSISIPGLGYFGGNKTRIDTADGWGTLTTPYGTFPVLRVKSVIYETDTIHLDTLGGFGVSVPLPVVTEYKWLGINQRIPLLQINTSGFGPAQIFYRDSVRGNPLAIVPIEEADFHFQVYPNPASDKFNIDFNLIRDEEISIDVFNSAGVKMFSESYGRLRSGNQHVVLHLDKNISSGIYFLKLCRDGKDFSVFPVIKE